MSAFRRCALASPLVFGFLIPFLLALGRERGWRVRKRAGVAATGAAAWIALLGVLWIFSGEAVARLLTSACFLLAFGAFLVGLFHLLGGRAPAQVGCGLVVVLMVGTLFYFDPILEHAMESRLTREQFQTRVDLALEGNPYAVMAYSIFEEDLLTRKVLYPRTLLADLQRAYPDWSRVALGYVLAGFWCFVAHLVLVALRMRIRGR